jgi:hypothetical protein
LGGAYKASDWHGIIDKLEEAAEDPSIGRQIQDAVDKIFPPSSSSSTPDDISIGRGSGSPVSTRSDSPPLDPSFIAKLRVDMDPMWTIRVKASSTIFVFFT